MVKWSNSSYMHTHCCLDLMRYFTNLLHLAPNNYLQPTLYILFPGTNKCCKPLLCKEKKHQYFIFFLLNEINLQTLPTMYAHAQPLHTTTSSCRCNYFLSVLPIVFQNLICRTNCLKTTFNTFLIQQRVNIRHAIFICHKLKLLN